MIVADTSALLSLATGDALDRAIAEFDLATTETVREELKATAAHDDDHARVATRCLEALDATEVHSSESDPIESARIDAGEGSCAVLVSERDAEYLLTDDLRALPELEEAVTAEIAISPFLLAAMVRRGVLDRREAEARLETIAENRSWLGTPIYRRARGLLGEEQE